MNQTVRNFALSDAVNWPQIDYSAHPAFAPGSRSPDRLANEVHDGLAALHAGLEDLWSERQNGLGIPIDNWIADHLHPRIAELSAKMVEALGPDNLLAPQVADVWRQTEADFTADIQAFDARLTSVYKTGAETTASRELREKNVHLARFADDDVTRLNAALAEHMVVLTTAHDFAIGKRYWRPLPLSGQWWNILHDLLKRHDFLSASSDYFGVDMVVGSVNLVYSSAQEVWWKHCYADAGVADSSLGYFHHDQDFQQIKSVVYLSDTDIDQGPFSYIDGGTKFRRSNILPHFYFRLGHKLDRIAKERRNGPAPYFRPGFQDPVVREAFIGLPPILHGSTHFGDDLLSGTAPSDNFATRERVVTSDKGNALLFNGGDIFHRGGLVRKGTRWTLQLMLEPAGTPLQQLKKRGTSLVKDRLGSVLGWSRYEKLRRS